MPIESGTDALSSKNAGRSNPVLKSHQTKNTIRKEKTAMPRYKYNPTKSNIERASVPGSKASITIEASLVIPIFLFAMLCLIYTLEIQTLRTQILFATENAAKEEAAGTGTIPIVNTARMKQNIIRQIGKEKLNRSIIVNGADGIKCSKSYLSVFNYEIHAKTEYSVQLPFPEFTNIKLPLCEKMIIKAWNGNQKKDKNLQREAIVYITEYGIVYHEDLKCPYLEPKIKYVSYEEVKMLRNLYREKYTRCTKCVYGSPLSGVYVSEHGNKYHNSLNCSSLKRNIFAVKKTEAGIRKGCSKCTH